eukprot:TRINITY_DN12464_c0_g1_i1.p1 TRINITY_DN12464_c0_g1~~TRINITY_DN12464_c0_g1_i1.p1  ORF type:complete len:248 (-),score=50.03 TRINITY_DN12464_c0_g1_i1:31-774(-)
MLLKKLVFFARVIPLLIWFQISVFYGFVLALYRFRDPSLGFYLGRVVGYGGIVLAGVKYNIRNAERLYEIPNGVYIGNHQSAYDLAIIPYFVAKKTVCVAKKSFFYIPIFGILWWISNQIFIDRRRRDKAIGTMDGATKRIKHDGHSIWVFPEGTRNWLSDDSELLPFKKGCFHTAVQSEAPIVPVVVSPYNNVIDLDNYEFKGGVIDVQVLKPIHTKGLSKDDVDELTKTTNEAMIEAMRKLQGRA